MRGGESQSIQGLMGRLSKHQADEMMDGQADECVDSQLLKVVSARHCTKHHLGEPSTTSENKFVLSNHLNLGE